MIHYVLGFIFTTDNRVVLIHKNRGPDVVRGRNQAREPEYESPLQEAPLAPEPPLDDITEAEWDALLASLAEAKRLSVLKQAEHDLEVARKRVDTLTSISPPKL